MEPIVATHKPNKIAKLLRDKPKNITPVIVEQL